MRVVASGGIGKEKSGAAVVEAEQRRHAEIALDGMQIERRQRDVMGISEPAAFARTLPGVLLRFVRNLPRQRFPDVRARLVEADPYRRAGGEGKHGAAQLALQIEHQIVFARRAAWRSAGRRWHRAPRATASTIRRAEIR